MLDERALSTLYGMTDLYIVGLGGGEQDRARREAEREAERRRLADRYARYLVAGAEVGEATARRVITALFDPCDADGNECPCSCHPRLSAEHGDGFDCRCTWDEDRRANTMGHGCSAQTAGSGWVRRADMAGPDLPRPREPFTSAHLQRWPMGAERTELLDGQLYWSGEFDERDAMVARRALPGSRIRVKPGVGLIAGPVLEDEPESRERTDEEGTRWHEMNGMTLYQRRSERNWTMRPLTQEERRHNTEQLAAYRAEGWARTVAAYAANPADVLAAWHYLTAHPVFWTYLVPSDLADIDPREVDEATWARIEAEGWLSDSDGLACLDVSLGRSGGRLEVRAEHGPVLWPLDVPAQHRAGLRVGGTPSHDPSLDVAEPTWEEAIVALAAKVRQRYGDDRAQVPEPQSDRDNTA